VDVVAEVELRIRLPLRQTKVKRREHGALPVTRDKVQLRLDKAGTAALGNPALELARGGNVYGLAFALEIQEKGVSP
jgi:hypothetical protein